MQRTIIAKYHDGEAWNALGIIVESDLSVPGIVPAIRAAAQDFTDTPRGQAVVCETGGDFNYGDFVNNIPNTICRKHGFTVVDTFIADLIVDHDERLIS